jgi:uncharacterized protein (TIGR00255 family)
MTGFGKTTCEFPGKKIHIEIKSLNSKQLDLNLRIPTIYREKELEMRNLLSTGLQRGKVDISISIESLLADRIPQINEQVFEHYYKQLSQLTDKLQINSNSDYIRTILTLPETLKVEQAELEEEEWKALQEGLSEAIVSINNYRSQEGAALYEDITSRINKIDTLSREVVPFEKQRIERIKSRIKENLDEWTDKNIDENRFEQELIYYLEKLDITEEKVRLKNHIDYFNETIAEEEPVGKKLAFIIQEIGREINTLGSKANDADIQRLVIRMKDELEKIKEQMLNIL